MHIEGHEIVLDNDEDTDAYLRLKLGPAFKSWKYTKGAASEQTNPLALAAKTEDAPELISKRAS